MVNEKIMLEFNKIDKNKSYLVLKEIGLKNKDLVYTTESIENLKVVNKEWIFPAIKKFEVHDILEQYINLESYFMNRKFYYQIVKGSELSIEFFEKYGKVSNLKDLLKYVETLFNKNEISLEENKMTKFERIEYINNVEKYKNHIIVRNKVYLK